MDGSRELAQLAELLRVGAETGRQIATLRPLDRDLLHRLARQAEAIAEALDAMLGREPGQPATAGKEPLPH